MMRFFSTKIPSGLANEMTKAIKETCQKLGVNSLENLKLVDSSRLGEENTILREKLDSVFTKVSTSEKINANAEVAEEAMRNRPYW